MSILAVEIPFSVASAARVDSESLTVDLADGRTIAVPLAWFPRVANGSPAERSNWRKIGVGEGLHWPDLDEDIEIAGLLAGFRWGETQESLARWLQSRRKSI